MWSISFAGISDSWLPLKILFVFEDSKTLTQKGGQVDQPAEGFWDKSSFRPSPEEDCRFRPSKINGYEREVYTHFEVGLSILSKEADVGIATIAVSKLLGLPFIPITQESFDMILDQSTFFEKGIQAFIEILNSQEFRNRVERLGSYDFKNSGKILYSKN